MWIFRSSPTCFLEKITQTINKLSKHLQINLLLIDNLSVNCLLQFSWNYLDSVEPKISHLAVNFSASVLPQLQAQSKTLQERKQEQVRTDFTYSGSGEQRRWWTTSQTATSQSHLCLLPPPHMWKQFPLELLPTLCCSNPLPPSLSHSFDMW